MHRPPEGQERNGVTRAQSRTRGRGGGGEWMDWAGLGDGFGPPRLGVGDMAKISYQVFFIFFYITIHDFITILCHVGFSILQVV